jgi:hypothetical protein
MAADAGMSGHPRMAADRRRRGDLDRTRLALAAASFLAACVMHAAGPGLGAIGRWLAPAFFAVAGCSATLAARRGSAVERVVASVLRLFVPAVTGFLLLAVPLLFLERPGEVDEWAAHLAFLPALLACSLAMLPVLMRLRSPRGPLLAERLARPVTVTIALLLPVALPAALAAIPRAGGLAWLAGACVAGFALGAVVAAGPLLEEAVNRRRWASLATAIALFAGFRAAWTHEGSAAVRPILEAAAAGSLAPLVLGFGLRRASAERQVPGRLNDYVLPFFVLSRPAFLAAGRAVAGLPVGAVPLVSIAAVTAAALSVGACELVRRPRLLRFLFGLGENIEQT